MSNKWLDLVKLLAPIIIGTVKPELVPISAKITAAIDSAEQIKGASGADKLKHVQEIADAAADSLNAVKGHVVLDKTKLDETVSEAVNAVVAATNIVVKNAPVTPEAKAAITPKK